MTTELSPSNHLMFLEEKLSDYKLGEENGELTSDLLYHLSSLENALGFRPEAEAPLHAVRTHVSALRIANEKTLSDEAEKERQAALSACRPLHDIINQHAR